MTVERGEGKGQKYARDNKAEQGHSCGEMGEEEEAVQGYSQVSGLTTWSANGGIMN